MKLHKLESTNAFIAFDLDDAPAVGITRLARKVLQDGAKLLARSTTYSFASFDLQMGGGSAGINADGDDRDPAVEAFVTEVTDLISAGRWATDPGLGLSAEDFAALRDADPRPSELWADGLADALTVQGALAAAAAVHGSPLSGARAALFGKGPLLDAARSALVEVGVESVTEDVEAEVDVTFVAGKAGVLDHEVAMSMHTGVVAPLTPVPVTARAHAELTKAGTVHLPDFLTTAGPLLHAYDSDGTDPVGRITDVVSALVPEGTGLWLAATERAEAFLLTWRDELPTFRPLA